MGEVECLSKLLSVICFGRAADECPYLALGEHRLDVRPGDALCGVAEQVHDNGTLLNSLVDLEEILAGYPAIFLRLFPAYAVLSHANDDVEPVVAKVQPLSVTLRAVADEREGVVLEVFLYLRSVSRP